MTTIGNIYDYINGIMPFDKAERYDNCGLLVGRTDKEVTGILTCLDITNNAVYEAAESNANLIVSHHPIIFDPVKRINGNGPLYKLINKDIAAICCHTNADIAECGTNGAAYDMLREKMTLGEKTVLERLYEDGSGIGWICECESCPANRLAKILSGAFRCTVRYTDNGEPITKIAFCSGSGGSMLDLITDKNTAYITGDVKHNVFVEAENRNIPLFDCTHYATEILFAKRMGDLLSRKFPDLHIRVSTFSIGYIHESKA